MFKQIQIDPSANALSNSMKLAISHEKSFAKPSIGDGIGLAESTNSSIVFLLESFSVSSTLHPACTLEQPPGGVLYEDG
jgi:hypothetical protein